MNFQPIRNEKTLTPNEEVVKLLLEELIKYFVNLKKIKSAAPQRNLVGGIIKLLTNRKKDFTYQDLFNLLLTLMRMSKTKESIAITSNIFKMVQQAYKDNLKQKP